MGVYLELIFYQQIIAVSLHQTYCLQSINTGLVKARHCLPLFSLSNGLL